MKYFFTAGHSPAMEYACKYLQNSYAFLPSIDSRITHLLLPVPSFDPCGYLKGGGELRHLLSQLSPDITLIGGNFPAGDLDTYRTIDLLKDPLYLAQNARITAHCALEVAAQHLPLIFPDMNVLILGWGRIAKCLASLLRNMGASVTIYARKEADRAMAESLEFHSTDLESAESYGYHVIFNTIPALILPNPPENCVKIDLASTPGIGGSDVIFARFLPGKYAPESSGKLIAQTVIRLLRDREAG